MIQVRRTVRYGKSGWSVSGANSSGRRLRVFFQVEAVARREAAAHRANPKHVTSFEGDL